MIEGDGVLDTAATPDAWDPVQYGRFAEQRAQPFWDLVALIHPPPSNYGFGRCADLGCGSGELTAALTERLGIDEMVGLDSSDAMLAEARSLPAAENHRLRFAKGDIGRWTSRADHDLVVANASMQWASDHPAVLERWWAALAQGGQLAVQVPANSDHPSHCVADQVATTEPFLSAFNFAPPPDPVAINVLAPDQYSMILDELGAEQQHVRLQVYPHRLKSSADVVEWVKGTSLTRFTRLLSDELAEQFVAAYRDRLLEAIGDTSPYFYPFKRILLWGRKP